MVGNAIYRKHFYRDTGKSIIVVYFHSFATYWKHFYVGDTWKDLAVTNSALVYSLPLPIILLQTSLVSNLTIVYSNFLRNCFTPLALWGTFSTELLTAGYQTRSLNDLTSFLCFSQVLCYGQLFTVALLLLYNLLNF